jgi:isochorismate synthase
MMNLFDKVKSQFTAQLPFVLFSKPNSNKLVGVFQNNDELHNLIDFTENGFVFVSFDGSQNYYLPYNQCDVIVDTTNTTDFHFTKEVKNEVNEEAKSSFEKLVSRGIQAIKNGDFQKVVLSRQEIIEIESLDIESIFKQLIFNYKTAFKYCFFHPKIGLWIGATPEQFIKIEDDVLKTVALAGTQLVANEIVWEAKEKQEQQFVTDFISDNLKQFSSEVVVSEPMTIQAGNLVHLKTDIKAKIEKEKLGSIIKKMHPTPAVCGLPKEEAKLFILDNEGYDREFYTGFLGELNIDFTTFRRENSDLFVNLRCMKMNQSTATVFVGCGITKESNPEKEFFETVNKTVTIKKSIL